MRGIEELSRLFNREEIRSLEKELGGAIQKKLEKSGIYFRIFARVKEAGSIGISWSGKGRNTKQRTKSFRILPESVLCCITWTIFLYARSF